MEIPDYADDDGLGLFDQDDEVHEQLDLLEEGRIEVVTGLILNDSLDMEGLNSIEISKVSLIAYGS